MISNAIHLYHRLLEIIDDHKSRKLLENKDFSLISNNCWGSKVYQDLKIRYNTPFIGLFLFAPCYINLLSDFDKVYSDLQFIEKSKYNTKDRNYPIAILEQDIEIHFMHYKTEKEAEQKWNKRIKRINENNLFFQFSDRDLCTYEHLSKYDCLSHENKICFTAQKYPELKSVVHLQEFSGMPFIDNIYYYSYTVKRHFDIVAWLNSGLKN